MTQRKTQALRPKSSNSHSIEKIISAPLVAASQANGMMQKTQASFIMDVGFEEKGGKYHPRMIEMVLQQPVMQASKEGNEKPSFSMMETTFRVPLLTILPISSLAVNEVNVKFEMEVNEHIQEKQDYGKTATQHFGKPDETTKLSGKVSYDSQEKGGDKTQYRRKNSSSLKVDIKAGTLPLPNGLNVLLDAFQKSIHPIDADIKQINNPQE